MGPKPTHALDVCVEQVARKEAARIVLHGQAEFEASHVILEGDQVFEVTAAFGCPELACDRLHCMQKSHRELDRLGRKGCCDGGVHETPCCAAGRRCQTGTRWRCRRRQRAASGARCSLCTGGGPPGTGSMTWTPRLVPSG